MLLVHGPILYAQDLFINEVMSSNSSTISDEDGDTEDWIEIYYMGNEPLNLEGFGLSDDYDLPFRWVFPDITIQPGQFLLIWASNKNRGVAGSELHTNFAISSAGEEIVLTHPDGTRLDELPPTEIQTDVSVGRYPDGIGDWVFFSEPTPGSSNHSGFYLGQLTPPKFSHPAGYYPGGVQLTMSHPENDVEIFYSLDGSEPTKESIPYNGEVDFNLAVNDSLMFIQTTPDEGANRGYEWKKPPEGIPGAYVVRAKAFKPGYLPSKITARTFLKSETQHTLPVISITTNKENLFDEAVGIYVPGKIYEVLGWPTHDYWGRPNANYHQRGVEWERSATFELIEKDGTYHVQNIGMRIHGGGSRALPQKSLRLYARSEYGDSRFNYDMFQNGETGYNRLILRNSGQDFYSSTTMFMDAFSQTLVSDLSFDTMDYRPFVVYLNGEFWGIKNLRERYDKHYLSRNYELPDDRIDLLSDNSVVKEGSADYYNSVLDSLEQYPIDDLGGMEFIERHIDVQNFTEFNASQIYFNNVDWPGNNNEYWRYTGPPERRGSPRDGRFRWLMFDLDFGMGYLAQSVYDVDFFDHLLSDEQTNWANAVRTTLMFRSFVKNREFLEYYLNTQMDLLNSYMNRDHTSELLYQFKDLLNDEIVRHIERWGYPADYSRWVNNIERRAEFIDKRPDFLIGHIQSRFQTGEGVSLTVDHPAPGRGLVQLNTLKLTDGLPGTNIGVFPWTGIYFADVPVELSAQPRPGYRFDFWDIDGKKYHSQEFSIKPEEGMQISAHFAEIPEPEEDGKTLLYFWHFDESLPNDTPLETILSTFSSTGTNGVLRYHPAISPYPDDVSKGTDGILDRVNDPTEINYRAEGNFNRPYDEEEMRGIRVRNPSVAARDGRVYESALVLDIPAEDYEGLVITFAAKRTPSGQEVMVFHYSVNEGEPVWIQDGLSIKTVETLQNYGLFMFDFSDFEEHKNNPDFRFKISFSGKNITGNDGNTRFNNIAVFGSRFLGVPTEDIDASRIHMNYPNPFNTSTNILYVIHRESDVVMDLFSITGQRIARLVDERRERGNHSVQFHRQGLASGVYILRLQAGEDVDHQKITLIK